MRNSIRPEFVLGSVLAAASALQGEEPMMHSSSMHHHAMESMSGGHEMEMEGFLGKYRMTRESSGTAWQPESAPMGGLHFMTADWMIMIHGQATLAYDHQGGRRGDEKIFSPNMLMLMAQRPVGQGTFGVRAMLSLEPATIGQTGYPELLQTGETADGVTRLIDRQHPHDLLMELAAVYSWHFNDRNSAFAYFGFPGEPALGPATFMHRFSGMDNPEAPITHHWLDSTHITFGVGTLGYIWRNFKVDASVFTGREPDEHRWDFDRARFDSYSARVTWNPSPAWSMQVSYGSLHSPEQLEPGKNVDRTTASVSYHHSWDRCHWETTLAWGRNDVHPGPTLDAGLLESALRWGDHHTVFSRAEAVEKDEFFQTSDPRSGRKLAVYKAALGYIYDFKPSHHLTLGVGAEGSAHFLPSELRRDYGQTPLSFLCFIRAKL